MAPKAPEELKAVARRYVVDGWSVYQVARLLGFSRTTVAKWCDPSLAARQKRATREWVQSNPGRCRGLTKRWLKERDSKQAEYSRRYYEKNREYYIMRGRARKMGLRKWPCSEVEALMIKYRYEDARRLTKETGIEYHVDHIIPLAKGGPHQQWNLQVITKAENLSKGAKI